MTKINDMKEIENKITDYEPITQNQDMIKIIESLNNEIQLLNKKNKNQLRILKLIMIILIILLILIGFIFWTTISIKKGLWG